MKRQRKTSYGCVLLLLLSFIVLSAAWFYTTWSSSQTVLPPGLVINELPMGGMTRGQALLAIEQAYTVPVTVTYAGEVLPPLLPEMIELRVDVPATVENLDKALADEANSLAFFHYLVDRILGREHDVIRVNAVVLYSRERVNAFLERTAQKYDHGPLNPVALPDYGTFRPAQEGTTLDQTASLPPLIDAILAAEQGKRQVTLVVEIEPAPEASIDILAQALQTIIADLEEGIITGLFAKDLSTGQEYCLNCRTAFSGDSVAKLGIAITAYREQAEDAHSENSTLMIQALGPGEDALAAANTVLAQLGNGDADRGTQEVTALFLGLGLESSYLTMPLSSGADPTANTGAANAVATPANTQPSLSTSPNPDIQTTPMEAALLLESVYYCARNGGALRILYARAMTPAKCQRLLTTLDRHRAHSRLGRNLPLGIPVAHQQAQHTTTSSEVALFYGSRTDFILAAFLYQPEAPSVETATSYFTQIGHLVYRFFNGD